jgi:hypothetical protein
MTATNTAKIAQVVWEWPADDIPCWMLECPDCGVSMRYWPRANQSTEDARQFLQGCAETHNQEHHPGA